MLRRILSIALLIILQVGCTPAADSTNTAAPDAQPTSAPTSRPTADGAALAENDLYAPQASDEGLLRHGVTIGSAEIVLLKSNPPMVRLHIIGKLPSTCHVLRVVVAPADSSGRINVTAYSLVEPKTTPAEAKKPFTTTLSLDGNPAGQYTVWLNDVQVGEVVVSK